MRLRLRAAAFLALIFAGITCSEPSTGPRASTSGDSARISLVPRFSPAAEAAYRTLAAAAIEIAEIHIVLTGPDGSTRDTVIAFPVGQETAHIEIDVPPGSNGQPFTALIELRSADHVVLFSGIQIIIARPSGLPPLAPPAVLINYTGPGRNTRAVTVRPADTTVVGSPTIAYSATGVDSSGAATASLLVAFTSSDPTIATVTGTGSATANVVSLGKRGTTTITATTPLGITGTSRLTVVPAATRLVVVSGGGQTDRAGTTLPQPFVVEAQGADNLPVPGTAITFRAVTAGGSVSQTTPRIADATGRASVTMTLGSTAGSYQYEAASGALTPVTVSQTATQPAASAIAIVSGNAQTDSTGRTLPQPLVVRVTDAIGGPVSGATVTWARVSGSGAVSAANTTTAADGTASISYTLGTTLGDDIISATVPSIVGAAGTVQFTATTIARGAGLLTITAGGAQSGGPGSTLPVPITARVADVNGLPLANRVVSWSASANGATFNPASSSTDAGGFVSTSVTLGSAIGPVTITASSGTLSAVTTATVVVGAPVNILKSAGDNQSATVSTAVSVRPSVTVTDVAGNPVPGVGVVFSVTGGGGSATGTSVTTNASGVATVGAWTLGSATGPNSLTATAGSLSAVFSATGVSGSGSVLAFITAPAATATSGTPLSVQPVLQLKDGQGNNVLTAGVVVTASIASGTGSLTGATATSAADGSVTFSGLTITGTAGNFTLSFASPGYAPLPSGTIVVSAGTGSSLAFVTTPPTSAASGVALSAQPVVQLKDANGNNVATAGVVVSAAVVSGSGTLANATATTNSSGTATFAGLTISGTAGQFTLGFSAPGYTTLNSAPIALAAGPAMTIALNAGNGQSATVGTAVAIPPSVLVTDASGNAVAGFTVTYDVVTTGATISSGTTTGTTVSVTTNTSGIAALASWTLGSTVQPYTLHASGTNLQGSPVVFQANGVAGAGSQLAFITPPGTSAAQGVALTPQPVVQLKDANGNNVPTAGVVVTIVQAGPRSLTNPTATTNASGVATFSGFAISGLAGSFTVSFGAPGYSALQSPVITLTAGAPASIVINSANNQSAVVGSAVPAAPTVTVTDAFNNVVSGAVVTFSIVTPGSVVANSTTSGSSVTVATSATGVASLRSWTLGSTAQTYTMTAAVAGASNSPVTFTATATPASGSVLLFTQTPSASATSGLPLAAQPAIQLRDSFGNNIATAGVVVTASITSGAGTLANATATTNAGGLATFSGLAITGTAGNFALQFVAPGYSALPFSPIALSAGGAANLALSAGNGQTTAASTAVPVAPAVLVTDASGNPIAGTTVTFSIVTPGATVANASTSGTTVTVPTAANGIATLTAWTLGAVAQPYTMQASVAGLSGSPVTFTATATAGTAASIALNAGNGQSATVGTAVAVPPSVRVADAGNNPVAGVVVTFTSTTPGATIANASTSGTTLTVTTNPAGIAALNSWTLGTTAQPYALTASASGLSGSPVGFTATATAAGGSVLSFNPAPSPNTSSGQPIAQQPGVQLRDSFNNPIQTAGVVVTATITSGSGTLTNATATSNAFGTAQFNNLTITGTAGTFNLQFAAPGYTALSSSITLFHGFAANLALSAGNGQTAPAGTPVPVAPAVLVTDASGNPVAGIGVAFTVVTPGSVVANSNTNGTAVTVTTGANGVATLTSWTLGSAVQPYSMNAAVPGLTGSPVNFTATATAGSAANIILNAGGIQSGTVGTPVAVPPSVRVTDANGNAVAGTTVTFAIVTPGSVVDNGTTFGPSVTVTTNAAGIATLNAWTLGTTAQLYTMNATSPGLSGNPVQFNATAAAGAAANIAVQSGNGQTATVGSNVSIPPAVRVTDQYGNNVAGTVVTFNAVTAGSSIANASTTGTTLTVTTNAAGVAALNSWTLGNTVGTYSLTASASGLTGSPVTFTADATAATHSAITFTQAPPSTASSGVPLSPQPSIQLRDSFGNPVARSGVGITANIISGSGGTTNSFATTDASGLATYSGFSIIGQAGTSVILQYSAASCCSVTSGSILLSAGAASAMTLAAGNNQTATVDTNVPTAPAVLVTDAASNPVAGVVVTFSAVTGNGSSVSNGTTTAGSVTVTTNASGIATLTAWHLGTVAQAYSMTATVSGLGGSPVTFNATATAGPPAAIAVAAGQNQTAPVGTAVPTAPSVRVVDGFGNGVPGATVNWNTVPLSTVSNGTTSGQSVSMTTNATGFATLASWTLGNTAGAYRIDITVNGLTATQQINATATAGTGSVLAFTQQPSSSAVSGVALATQPIIQIRDSFGNPVNAPSVLIVATISSGSGTLTSASATTNASGTATFSGLAINGQAGNFTLQFNGGGFTPASFGPIAVSAGSAANIASNGGNGQSAQVATAVAVNPSVLVTDAVGNPVAGTVVTFASITGNGSTVSNSGGPGPSVTVTTNASGIAAVSAWTLGTVAQQYTLTATVAGLTGSPVTFTATATPGSLFALQIVAGDDQTAPVGAAVPVDPSVRAVDANGNGVGGVVVTFDVGRSSATVSNATSTGSTVTVTTDAAGMATVTAWNMGTTSGLYLLDATTPGVSGVQFSSFATAGSGSQLTLTQTPSTSVASGQAFPTQPLVQLRDGFGNAVNTAGVQVAAQITSGNGQLTNFAVFTDNNGEAHFTTLTLSGQAGSFNIQFVASGYTALPFGPITLGAGTASTMALQAGNNQSVQYGQPVPIPPAVLVTDPSGNPVQGVTVTFTPVTTGGQVQNSSTSSTGPLDVVTNAQGIAALDAFYVGNQAGNYTLTASAAGLSGSPVSFTETALAGPATHLAFFTTPSGNGQSGVALATQPVVELRDAAGNVVPQSGVGISTSFGAGTGSFTNGAAITDATGRATFSGFAVNGIAGNYTILFNASTLTSVGAPLTLAAGPAVAIVNSITGSTSVTNDVAFPAPPQVRLRDSGGNNISQTGVTITATVIAGNGTVTAGGTATTNTQGVATFTGITLTGMVGTYQIRYSSGALTPFNSGLITLNTGAAANIAVAGGTGQSATIGSPVPVPPSVLVTDVSGNPVAGNSVTFNAGTSGAQVQNSSTSGQSVPVVTDAAGIAKLVLWSLAPSTPGTNTLTITASGTGIAGNPRTVTATGVVPNGFSINITTRPNNTASGIPLSPQPVVRITNGQGLPGTGVQVTAFITVQSSQNATLTGTVTATTDSNGFATFTNLVVTGSPGGYLLRFGSPGYQSTAMSLSIP